MTKTGKKTYGQDAQCYFVADIGANHDADLMRAKELIYLASEAGADAVKFQHFNAATIVSDHGFKNLSDLKTHQSSWKKSVFEVYSDASVDFRWTEELVETSNDAGIALFTTPYDFDIVDKIYPYVDLYKIGSGDITWLEMIEKVASKGKPYLLATGAADMNDVCRAVEIGLAQNKNLTLMQCNTNYTGDLENFKYANLRVLKTFKNMYPELRLGLSDHTPGHATALGAIALGAKTVEKHFTDDNIRVGPDHSFALNPKAWREMIDRARELELALGDGVKKVEDNEMESIVVQQRSICVKSNLSAGHLLTKTDLIPLRPCPNGAFKPYQEDLVLGRRLVNDMQAGQVILKSHLN